MSAGPPAVGTRYSATEIHDTVVAAAEEEFRRPLLALWWSAVAAGLLICFSFLGSAALSTLSTEPIRQHLLAAAGYPLGFIVVLSSTQLFTENTLEPILPLLEHPSVRRLGEVGRLWAVILAGNLVGAIAIAFVLSVGPTVPDWLRPALDRVAESADGQGFWHALYVAIFGGWLIALMAWLISTTQDRFAQIVLIWLTTAPIAAFGFRHSVAGSVEAFYSAFRGKAVWGAVPGQFLAPVILGNILGGGLLVALLFYGQVSADKRDRKQGGRRART